MERTARRLRFGVQGGVGLDPEIIDVGAQALFGPVFSPNVLVRSGLEIGFGEVTRLSPADGGLWCAESADETWLARAVIVATGLAKGSTGLAEEAQYEGRGVSHCAVCDGPLYKNKPVAVYGDSRWTAVEAKELAEYASAVTVIASRHDDRVATLADALPRPVSSIASDSALTRAADRN